MRRPLLLLFVLSLHILLLSCSKEPIEEENRNPEDNILMLESGEGGVFIGATADSKEYSVTLTHQDMDFKRSTSVTGFSGAKYPSGCKVGNLRLIILKVPAGKYNVEVIDFHQASQYGWETEVEEGKCIGINATGTTW